MRTRAICLVSLLGLSAVARAGTCEDGVQVVGDPRNGLQFTGEVQMPGLSVSSALGQLQQLALNKSYEVGNESITGDSGELFFTQTNLEPPIVMRAQADSSGKVTVGTKLARGQKVDVGQGRHEICAFLTPLKTGKEGEAIAAAARQKTGAGQVIDAEAAKLSGDLEKEIKSAMAAPASKGVLGRILVGSENYATSGEYKEAFAPIEAKYKGRVYRIDGKIYSAARDQFTGQMKIAYLVTPTRGLLAIRESTEFQSRHFQIACTLTPDQDKFFATLSEGDMVKLQGTVDKIDGRSMELRDCRQAN